MCVQRASHYLTEQDSKVKSGLSVHQFHLMVSSISGGILAFSVCDMQRIKNAGISKGTWLEGRAFQLWRLESAFSCEPQKRLWDSGSSLEEPVGA